MKINFCNYNLQSYNNNFSFEGKSRNKNKREAQQIHFNNACITRLGETLDSKKIVKQIQQGKLPFLNRKSNNETRYLYNHNEQDYVIVYRKNTKQVVTIYPYREDFEDRNIDRKDFYWWLWQDNNIKD